MSRQKLFLGRGFRWTQEVEFTDQADLFLVRLAVLWTEQGREVSETVEIYQYRMSEGARRLSVESRRARSHPQSAPGTRRAAP